MQPRKQRITTGQVRSRFSFLVSRLSSSSRLGEGSERLALLSKMYSNGCVQRRSLGESILISLADDETRRDQESRDETRWCVSAVVVPARGCCCWRDNRVSVPGPNSQDVIGYQLATQRLDIAVRQQGTPCAPPGGMTRRTIGARWRWCSRCRPTRRQSSVVSPSHPKPQVASRLDVLTKSQTVIPVLTFPHRQEGWADGRWTDRAEATGRE